MTAPAYLTRRVLAHLAEAAALLAEGDHDSAKMFLDAADNMRDFIRKHFDNDPDTEQP